MPAVTIVFKDKDPKRHSIRWDAPKDSDPIVSTIYISKPHFEKATAIKVTIEEVGLDTQ